MKIVKFLIIVAVTFLAFHCKTRIADFSMLSTQNVPLERLGSLQKGDSSVSGADEKWVILVFPTGWANIKEATDQALAKVPGAVALTDVRIYYSGWWAILVGKGGYVVEGIPLIDKSKAQAISQNRVFVADSQGVRQIE